MLPQHKLQFFAKFIESELGIVYSDSNYFQLQNRLEEIVKILGFKDIDALCDNAQTGITGSLKQLLLDVATNNETSFFRDAKIFQAIDNHIIPKWMKENPGKTFRVWSAASSFGQEPYTLAMMFSQHTQLKNPLFQWKITATDIADRAIKRASEGKYSQLEVQRGLPATYLVKYFKKTEDNYWIINPEIKDKVTFKKLNLLDQFSALGQFDLVLCRNVLIYQRVENKAKVIEKISKILLPGGHLIMGAGESLIGISEGFEQTIAEGVVFYRTKTAGVTKKAA